jgi:hypothetical protein
MLMLAAVLSETHYRVTVSLRGAAVVQKVADRFCVFFSLPPLFQGATVTLVGPLSKVYHEQL